MTPVLVYDEGDRRLVTLNRPEKRNALDVEAAGAVAAAVQDAADAGVRSVILTGAPPAFCAGGDLPALAAVAERGSLVATDAIYRDFHGIVRAIRDSPLPVIAAVNGAAMGARLDLALCCDLRVAAEAAVFQSTWVRAGLVPGMGGARHLPHVVGSARAASMLLLGRSVTAAEALEFGLVNEVVPDGEAAAAAARIADEVAALPTVAVARTKAALRRGIDADLDAELATLGAQQGQLLLGEDFQKLARRLAR
ncbi:enoyl-CoA hydratase/isomerase family protein [Amycolatopsis acidiphila]|uniref:Enoyl-CoA hydratase/isomerase family protein n=1 Tax=Amycolatopsis acidiphila TaxID=715473 RepID=A0A557ZSE5_9PSEU|nr:enoyl-CoA hydratase/isomerase family protein [Amycolatopsis acidiphila]TVT14937.1 enoyl-CoA hydratase/isomerase family protein [Amycolatopsis acidiphila]UIJ63096.1 enoyl-CoA hydratase/isomerase family protein [Amycolatopsis acidiphila]GHG66108.1 enoyl-CoA hydratase [Amycolatopsis acidiphila]